jgi:hypothetical protein
MNYLIIDMFLPIGMSYQLERETHFTSLDRYYRSFAYGRVNDYDDYADYVLKLYSKSIILDEKIIFNLYPDNLFHRCKQLDEHNVHLLFKTRSDLVTMRDWMKNIEFPKFEIEEVYYGI